jgi:hypothetical protein
MMAAMAAFGPIALGAVKQAWTRRAWLIPVLLAAALAGAIAWGCQLLAARAEALAEAAQYRAAARSAEAAIDKMKIHQAHIDAAIGASHAAELARLASLSKIRQGVAGAPPAPACPPDPAVLHGLELLRRGTHG